MVGIATPITSESLLPMVCIARIPAAPTAIRAIRTIETPSSSRLEILMFTSIELTDNVYFLALPRSVAD